MPLLRSGVLCYTIAKPPEQFRCGGNPYSLRAFPQRGKQGDLIRPSGPPSPCAGKAMGDGVRRHTAALLNPCDTVQILCNPKLHFSFAGIRSAYPRPSYALLFHSFTLPSQFYTKPMRSKALPCRRRTILCHCSSMHFPYVSVQFPCSSEPCLCGRGERAA